MILRRVVAVLIAAASLPASATVSTADYDRLALLPALSTANASRDWRANGAVTPVKNEGACDSSWAFAVTGLVEGYRAVNFGQLFNLSEQELIDCNHAGSGCSGGSPIDGMRTVVTRGGLSTSASYPYTALEGTCKLGSPVATIPGAGRVPPGEPSLQAYVDKGPVLALVATNALFDNYAGGTFTGPCPAVQPTRAVLIVGYDASHWIVKNSLGPAWGSSGYILMARGANLCGIGNYAIAVSDDPLPPPAPAAPIAVPTTSRWAVVILAMGFAAFGFAALRRNRRRASA